MTEESPGQMVTFIVRAARDHSGRLRGVIERVKTGEKRRFTGADGVAGLIERMLGTDAADRPRRC